MAIALILAAVFIPVAFLSGITGRLYQQFALTIAVSVLISAFNALTLSPALSALLLKPRAESHGILAKAGALFNRAFGRTTDGYIAVNRRLVRKLFIPLVLLAGVAGISLLLARHVPTGFVPDEDQGYAIIGVQLPDGASMQRTKAVYAKIDAVLSKEQGIKGYNGIAGFSLFTRTAAFSMGFIGLKPWEDRQGDDITSTAILKRLNGQFSRIIEA